MAKNLNVINEGRSLDDLYAWIDTIPLSRPKRNISRDFADGVLMAEVIAHFLPRLVELHNYNAASSSTQKKVNWQTLNRRVFSKMGMRISDEVIAQLIEAKPGIIERVLCDIRGKINQLVSTSEVKLTGKAKPNSMHRDCSLSAAAVSRTEEPPLTYRVTTPRMPQQVLSARASEATAPVSPVRPLTAGAEGSPEPVNNNNNNNNIAPTQEPKKLSPNSVFTQGFIVPPHAHQGQGYVAPPCLDTSPAALLGASMTIMDKNDNVCHGGPPAQIIYRGHKMIPLQFLEDKEKEIRALENSNKALTLKIHRLETLVNVKDQRIEDLTHQLQNLRSMYERVTETHYNAKH